VVHFSVIFVIVRVQEFNLFIAQLDILHCMHCSILDITIELTQQSGRRQCWTV